MAGANTQHVLTVKEAAGLSRLGKTLFYEIIGTKDGPPFKRVRGRILIPAKAFYVWLETPTKKPRKKG